MPETGTKNKKGTNEYADASKYNIMSGCQHGCIYCYAQGQIVRTGNVESPQAWLQPVIRPNDLLCNYRPADISVMYPSSHDIHPDNIYAHLFKIDRLLKAFRRVVLVTKAHKESVEAICWNFRAAKDKILFKFTIGTVNSVTAKFWEPYAPPIEERVESLKIARNSGFATGVSAEPLLDEKPYQLVRNLQRLVTDKIWIGRMNQGSAHMKVAKAWGPSTQAAYEQLMKCHSDDNILAMYQHLKGNGKVMWKDSMRSVIENRLGIKLAGSGD